MQEIKLCVAVGGNQQHGGVADVLCEVAQQLQRGGVSPMNVIEHNHERALFGLSVRSDLEALMTKAPRA